MPMRQSLHPFKGKIAVRIAILITIEVLLVVSSFGITTNMQSQSTNIGNTINIAGRNRFLTANFLLELEKINDSTAQLENISNALAALAENILVLKSGGSITSSSGDTFLMPLSREYYDKWSEISDKQIELGRYLESFRETDKPAIERTASELIESSDALTRQLGNDAQDNSQNLVLLQTTFIIGNAVVGGIVLYVIKRLLRPISQIIGATTKIESGKFAIPPIKHSGENDEISVLASSFNSMVEQLRRYDQMQKHFISIASHEIRGPLQPILGLSDILRTRLSNDSENREFADAIFYNAKRLQNTIDNVLQVTKIEEQLANLNKEKFDICQFLRLLVRDSQYQINASGKNLQLLFLDKIGKTECGSPTVDKDSWSSGIIVNADRTRLTQVFTNLLNNAIKSMTEGIISVSIAEQSQNKSVSSTGSVVISIRDTGTGISPVMFPKLFTKFGSDSGSGTGLGLYISKNIIESHGGRTWAENNSDSNGATFHFSLPVCVSEENHDVRDMDCHDSEA